MDMDGRDSTPPSSHLPSGVPAVKLYPSLNSSGVTGASGATGPAAVPAHVQAPSKHAALDAKVAEAVEQMRAMGFHDDGR